jgi:quinol monooxygenase YgiN
MSEPRISVVARLTAKPGMEEQVKQELMGLVTPSRKDKWCISVASSCCRKSKAMDMKSLNESAFQR